MLADSPDSFVDLITQWSWISVVKANELSDFDRELRLYGDLKSGSVTSVEASGGHARSVPCGPFHAVEVVVSNLASRRQALGNPWSDQAILMVQHDGTALARQYDHQTWLQRSDIYLMDTCAPLEIIVPKTSRATCIAVNRSLVAELFSRPEAVFGLKISGESGGIPRVLHHMVTGLLGDSHRYDNDETEAVSTSLQSLLMLGLKTPPCLAAALADADKLKHVKAWMLRNLDDPALDVAQIAKHAGISRSALYRLFAAESVSPMAWLTTKRLLQAHEILSQNLVGKVNVSSICYGLGFNDSAHFSRLFRKRFGYSPRKAALFRQLQNPMN